MLEVCPRVEVVLEGDKLLSRAHLSVEGEGWGEVRAQLNVHVGKLYIWKNNLYMSDFEQTVRYVFLYQSLQLRCRLKLLI